MRVIINITFFYFILVSNVLLSNPLQGHLKAFPKNMTFSNYKVNKIIQDQNGYMWIATGNGLFRFDGYEYEQHAFHENEKSTPLKPVRDIQLDDYGRIWIISNRNLLHCYDIDTQKLVDIKFSHFDGLRNISICDSLLIMDINGSSYYTAIDKDFQHEIEPIKFSESSYVPISNCYSSHEVIRYISYEYLVNIRVTKEVNIESTIKTPIKVSSSAIDLEGNSWICDGKSVYRYDRHHKKWSAIVSSGEDYNQIAYDKASQRLWLLTKSNIYYVDKGSTQPTKLALLSSQGLENIMIKKLFIDTQSNIWLTAREDIYLINFYKNTFHSTAYDNILHQNVIASVFQDQKGTLHYSTTSNDTYIINPYTMEYKKYRIGYVRHISSTPTSSLIFSFPNHSKIIDCSTNFNLNSFHNIKTKGYNIGVSFKKEILWTADLHSIKKHDLKQNSILDEYITKSIPNNFQYDALSHSLLVSTSSRGVLQIQLNQKDDIIDIKAIDKPKGLRSNLCITTLNQKNILWIATSVGLSKLKYNPISKEYDFIKNYTKTDGLTGNRVVSLIEENDSTLWIGTSNGLNKFMISQEKFITYLEEEGLISKNFTNAAAIKTKDGKLQFGTRNGLVVFDPNKIKNSNYIYTPYMNVLSINGKRGHTLEELSNLSPQQKNIQLKVSIPNYISPEAIRYRYKLQQDQEWTYSYASQNEISFYNLDFGEYTFTIQVSNENNEWNSEVSTFPIYINTPFWLKWWFILACILLLAATIFLYIRFSVKQFSAKRAFDLQRETDQQKIKFFTDVSHDLKTPLSMISEPVEKMRAAKLSEQERDFLLDTVSKNTNRLIKLVHKALEIGTTDKQEMSLKLQKTELVSFIKELVEMFLFEAKEKGILLDFEAPEKEVTLFIDKEKIERVLFNIVTNSLKNTTKQDKITIILKHDPEQEQVYLSIKDTGKGIKEEKLKHLFDRFYQADVAKEGQGIGLSIVQQYIEAHQGTVSIASKEGVGTEVSILLPKRNTHIKLEDNTSEIQPVRTTILSPNAQHSILLVEDDQELREYMIYELSSDYELYIATNGEEGLEIAEEKLPDLIITDFMMPKMSGELLCNTLKKKIKTAHIPIIMITAMGKSETQLLTSGANDFIAKPFKVKNLKLKIKNLLSTLQSTKAWVERELHLIPQPSNYEESEETTFVKELMQVIDKNLMNEKLNVNLLTKEIGISKTVLYKKASKLTGYTINELITSVKLKKAAELIVHSNYTFSEITFMLGYNSAKHFRNLFKDKYQMTMQDYKLKYKQTS